MVEHRSIKLGERVFEEYGVFRPAAGGLPGEGTGPTAKLIRRKNDLANLVRELQNGAAAAHRAALRGVLPACGLVFRNVAWQREVGANLAKVGADLIEAVRHQEEGNYMLRWAVIFFTVAIIAAIFGFGGIAGTAASIAQVLFYIFLAIFVISLLMGLVRGRGPRV